MKLAEALAYAAEQPLTIRCSFCPWTYDGTLEEGKHLAEHHRIHEHGIVVPKRRKQGAKSPWRSDRALDENIAIARQQGAATWAKP